MVVVGKRLAKRRIAYSGRCHIQHARDFYEDENKSGPGGKELVENNRPATVIMYLSGVDVGVIQSF